MSNSKESDMVKIDVLGLSQYTPREKAYDIAITALYEAFKAEESDMHELHVRDGAIVYVPLGPPSHLGRVKRQIAKLHNSLLTRSGLDGQYLSEDHDTKRKTTERF